MSGNDLNLSQTDSYAEINAFYEQENRVESLDLEGGPAEPAAAVDNPGSCFRKIPLWGANIAYTTLLAVIVYTMYDAFAHNKSPEDKAVPFLGLLLLCAVTPPLLITNSCSLSKLSMFCPRSNGGNKAIANINELSDSSYHPLESTHGPMHTSTN